MKILRRSRVFGRTLVGGMLFVAEAGMLLAQNTAPSQPSNPSTSSPAPASQDDNPFPGEPAKTPKQEKTGPDGKPLPIEGQAPGAQSGGDNPFPGEVSDVPIIPVDPGPGGNSASSGNSAARSRGGAPSTGSGEGDPVRSPDAPGNTGTGGDGDAGFSSSTSGLSGQPGLDDQDVRPGKAVKPKTRSQTIKENLDIGGFYLDKKNWKAAQDRFGTAFALDNENEEAVWGLAEAERHLQLYDKAKEHYELFLSYDPSGPHARAARKALEEVETARGASGPAAAATPHK